MIWRSVTGPEPAGVAALLILPMKSCRNRLDETPLRELTRWESATFGGTARVGGHGLVLRELGQGRPEVRTHLRHDVFAPFEHFSVEHAVPIRGDDHQVNLEIRGRRGDHADGGVVPAGVS